MTSKVLTFLSGLGQMVLQGLGLVPQITKAIETSNGQPVPVLDKLSQIASVAQQAEVIIDKVKIMLTAGTTIDKAAAIGPLVAQIVMSSEIVAGKEMLPNQQAAFMTACTNLGGDVADILNCFKPSTASPIPTQNVTQPPAPTAVIAPAPAPAIQTPAATPAPASPTPASFAAVESQMPGSVGTAAAIAAGNAAADLPQE